METKELKPINELEQRMDGFKVYIASDEEGNEINPTSSYDESGILYPSAFEKKPMTVYEIKCVAIATGKKLKLSSDEEGNNIMELGRYAIMPNKVILYPKHI